MTGSTRWSLRNRRDIRRASEGRKRGRGGGGKQGRSVRVAGEVRGRGATKNALFGVSKLHQFLGPVETRIKQDLSMVPLSGGLHNHVGRKA